jgi:excisionase family DNA binding protein
MAKQLRNGDWYLSPAEAAALLEVSYKTLQRWAEAKKMTAWVGVNGSRRRVTRRVQIDFFQTPTGYRYYKRDSIERLARDLVV